MNPSVLNITGASYTLRRFLGRGAYGEVWLAEAPGVEVAVKIIHRSLKKEETQRELESLQLIKRLHHPFLLALQAFFAFEDRLIIVLELAESSLRDSLDACRRAGHAGMAAAEVLRYFHDAAEALDYLHSHQVQHRDIKPDNLLLLGPHIKVADYGLARMLEQHSIESATTVGTPAYMAPEVWSGKVCLQTDQYSLAATYVELRTGSFPFPSGSLAQLINAHMNEAPKLDGLIPEEQQVVLRALAKEAGERFPSCSAFVAALSQALAGEVVAAPVVQAAAASGGFERFETLKAQPLKPAVRETLPTGGPHVATITEAGRNEARERPFWVFVLLAWVAAGIVSVTAWVFLFADGEREETPTPVAARAPKEREREPMVEVRGDAGVVVQKAPMETTPKPSEPMPPEPQPKEPSPPTPELPEFKPQPAALAKFDVEIRPQFDPKPYLEAKMKEPAALAKFDVEIRPQIDPKPYLEAKPKEPVKPGTDTVFIPKDILSSLLPPNSKGAGKARIDKLIAELGNESLAVRDNATRELEKVGLEAFQAVQKALASSPSPEMRRRLEALLARFQFRVIPPGKSKG